MSGRRVTITGGNGFVGRILQVGLRSRGYDVVVFDRMRGSIVDLLRARPLGTAAGTAGGLAAAAVRRAMHLTERALVGAHVIVPSGDDILDQRSRLVDRFRGSYAVIHLAGLAHPKVAGATEADYQRINFDGSVNAFEAARAAGVPRFVFSSSAQVYGINHPVRIDQFPILETNYCPTLAEGQNLYGHLKLEVERYLAQHCATGDTQSVSLRLEFPGARSRYPWNMYVSTSVENTVAGFVAALESDLPTGADVFNLADRDVDSGIVGIQQYLRAHWPDVPNRVQGNGCLLDTDKIRSALGYAPTAGGTYYGLRVMW